MYIAVTDVMVQVAEADELASSASPYCFSVTDGSRSLLLAAGCQQEKMVWMEELQSAIRAAKHRGDSVESAVVGYPSLKSNSMCWSEHCVYKLLPTNVSLSLQFVSGMVYHSMSRLYSENL